MRADGVFEGGGVKGIGLAGAVAVAEARGYEWSNVAGTSAGAIVAALVAAGYKAAELKVVLDGMDFNQFCDKGFLDRIPMVGPLLSVGFEKGLYEGVALEDWLRELLAAKGVKTFGDLVMEEFQGNDRYRFKLRVIVSDLSRGRLLVLPQDIREYGVAPESLDVARAVRMSASIPFFFEPVTLRYRGADGAGHTSYLVDGAILSNFPVWLFDEPGEPAWPTFGFKLVDPAAGKPNKIDGPLSMLAALFSTMMEAHDARYLQDHAFVRTIPIPTLGIKTTDFDLSGADKVRLYTSGREAAERFFARWDFGAYKQAYRSGAPRPGRTGYAS